MCASRALPALAGVTDSAASFKDGGRISRTVPISESGFVRRAVIDAGQRPGSATSGGVGPAGPTAARTRTPWPVRPRSAGTPARRSAPGRRASGSWGAARGGWIRSSGARSLVRHAGLRPLVSARSMVVVMAVRPRLTVGLTRGFGCEVGRRSCGPRVPWRRLLVCSTAPTLVLLYPRVDEAYFNCLRRTSPSAGPVGV